MAEKTFDDLTDVGADRAADSSTQIKKRARRRLVGAVALALLAVIVLPIAMDREPPPTGPEIQVRIPSQDATVAYAPATTRAKPVATQSAPPAVAPSKEDAAAERPTPAQRAETAKPEPVPAPAAAPVADPATGKGSVKETKAGPDNKAIKSVLKPEAKPDDKTRAEAALAGVTPAAKAIALNGGEKWIVQLGAYQNAGNVALLMGKLKEMKIPAYSDKFDSPQGPRTRVRAGPFPTKEAAAKAAERVKILGVSGPVAQASADKT